MISLWSVCVCMLSRFIRVRLSGTLRTVACQAPLSTELSRQEYWSELPFPSPGHVPNPEREPAALALAGGFLTTAPPGNPSWYSDQLPTANGDVYAAVWQDTSRAPEVVFSRNRGKGEGRKGTRRWLLESSGRVFCCCDK